MKEKKSTVPEQVPAVSTVSTVYALLTLPADTAETLAETIQLQAEALSPFDEGGYATGYEVLHRGEQEWEVLVAVASDLSLDDPWHDWLHSRGLVGSVRLDLTLLGWLRVLKLHHPAVLQGTHLVTIRVAGEQIILLLHNGLPRVVRALPPETSAPDFLREVMLVMTQAALTGGLAPESALAITTQPETEPDPAAVTGLTPEVKALSEEEADRLLQEGLQARAADASATFDLTPDLWLDEAKAKKQRRALVFTGTVLAVLWVLAALTLFLLPKIYARLSANVLAQVTAQHAAYQEVLDLRERVTLIERYQDRSYSALELLRLVCAAKAQNVTFLSFTYRQKQSLKISGLADDTSDVYSFKETLQKDERISEVKITRLAQDAKTRRQRFDVELLFPEEEEE